MVAVVYRLSGIEVSRGEVRLVNGYSKSSGEVKLEVGKLSGVSHKWR